MLEIPLADIDEAVLRRQEEIETHEGVCLDFKKTIDLSKE